MMGQRPPMPPMMGQQPPMMGQRPPMPPMMGQQPPMPGGRMPPMHGQPPAMPFQHPPRQGHMPQNVELTSMGEKSQQKVKENAKAKEGAKATEGAKHSQFPIDVPVSYGGPPGEFPFAPYAGALPGMYTPFAYYYGEPARYSISGYSSGMYDFPGSVYTGGIPYGYPFPYHGGWAYYGGWYP